MNITKLNTKRIVSNIIILNVILFALFIGMSYIFYQYFFEKTLTEIKEKQRLESSAVYKILNRYYANKELLEKYLTVYEDSTPYNIYLITEDGVPLYSGKLTSVSNEFIKRETGFFIQNNKLFYSRKLQLKEKDTAGKIQNIQLILAGDSVQQLKYATFKMIIMKGIALYIVIAYILSMLALIISRLNYDKFQTKIFGDLIKQTNDSVAVINKTGKVIFANDSFLKTFNTKLKDVLGQDIAKFKSSIHDQEFFKGVNGHLNREGTWEGDVINTLDDGTKIYSRLKITSIQNRKSKEKYMICIYENKTEAKMQKIDILRLQLYDSYTGLPNKTYAFKYLEKLIAGNAEFVYINLIILNFKEINNAYGFEIGDKLLLQFIGKIKGIFGEKTFIARVDGRKIGITVELSGIESLSDNLNKISEQLMKSYKIFSDDILIFPGIGLSFYPKNQLSVDEIMETKCESLDVFFKEENFKRIDDIIKTQVQIKKNNIELLKNALNNEEFSLNFQPRVDSIDNVIIGAEALLRWNSKSIGAVSPLYFIPLAEETGYIEEISKWTISNLCLKLAEWKKEFEEIVPVSLNISPYFLKNDNFIEILKEELNRHKLELNDVQIEITEKAIKSNSDFMKECINGITKTGIKVLVDNFGTGNSKLDYLKDIDISMIKIDREFIGNYPEKDDGNIVKVIINMAETLQIGVVGEGAENEEQIDFLRRNGCHIIQGYYYSKPLPPDEFKKLLELKVI